MVRLPALPLARDVPLKATLVPPSQSAPHAGRHSRRCVSRRVASGWQPLWLLPAARRAVATATLPSWLGLCFLVPGCEDRRANAHVAPRLLLFLTVQSMDRPMAEGPAAHSGSDMRLNDTLSSHLPATVHRGSFRIASLAAMAWLGLAGSAWSAPPTVASIEALLAATKSEALIAKTGADLERNMRDAVQASLQGRKPSEREQQVIDKMTRESAALIRQELNWSHMRPMMVQIYQSTFTQEEVDGQTAFYRTPVGMAVVEKMPAVMQATMAATQQSMARLMPQLQAIAKKHMAEAQAAGAAAGTPPAGAKP